MQATAIRSFACSKPGRTKLILMFLNFKKICKKNLECEHFCLSLQSQTKSEGVHKNGVIAQLVEQRTENPCVPGSIPGDTTLKIRELQKCDSLFFVVKNGLKWSGTG